MLIQLGSILLLWGPWMLLKRRGNNAVQSELERWNISDQAKGTMQNLHWRVREHSSYSRRAVLAIRLPTTMNFAPAASMFHPQAYTSNIGGYAAPPQPNYLPPYQPPQGKAEEAEYAPPQAQYPPPPRPPADAEMSFQTAGQRPMMQP